MAGLVVISNKIGYSEQSEVGCYRFPVISDMGGFNGQKFNN